MSAITGNNWNTLLEAVVINLKIMGLSSIVPLIAGVVVTVILGLSDKKAARMIFRIIGVVFYSLAPIALLYFLHFKVLTKSNDALLAIVVTLSISHFGYFFMHYQQKDSSIKNILVNLLGLLSSTFLWSGIAGLIGYSDMLYKSSMIRSFTFDPSVCFPALVICFGVLAILNIPRMILKEVMD